MRVVKHWKRLTREAAECPALQIDIQDVTGHGPEQPPPAESALNKGLD